MEPQSENSLSRVVSETEQSKKVARRDFIKSEVNFARLPFFALSRYQLESKKKVEYKDVVNRGGRTLEVLWKVTANAEYGYPGPFDKKVHKAVEYLISQSGLPITNPIGFSIYELCRIIGISHRSGRNISMIKQALLRTAFAGIQSKGTFYSKQHKKWIEDAFHLYDRVIFMGETLPNGETSDRNYVFLSDWYLGSLNAYYIKPFDYNYYRSLRSSIAGRLYEFLSLQFYATKCRPYHIDYRKLCQVLPVEHQRYFSKARWIFVNAEKELIETGFLEYVDWDKDNQDKKIWTITYYAGIKALTELKQRHKDLAHLTQAELQLQARPSKIRRSKIAKEEDPDGTEISLAKELQKRGITKSQSEKLSKQYPDRIAEKLQMFDLLLEQQSPLIQKNPAGWLVRAIQEDYQPSKQQVEEQERQKRRQEADDRKARWLEHRKTLIETDLANWDKTPPEERAKGPLDFWIAVEKLGGPQPTPEQIEVEKQKLIDSLPKTDEEKREYIAPNYPEEPPDDFK